MWLEKFIHGIIVHIATNRISDLIVRAALDRLGLNMLRWLVEVMFHSGPTAERDGMWMHAFLNSAMRHRRALVAGCRVKIE